MFDSFFRVIGSYAVAKTVCFNSYLKDRCIKSSMFFPNKGDKTVKKHINVLVILPNVAYDKVWSCYVVCFLLAFSLILVRKGIFKTFMAPCRHCTRHCSTMNVLTFPVKAYNLSREMERPKNCNDVTQIKSLSRDEIYQYSTTGQI